MQLCKMSPYCKWVIAMSNALMVKVVGQRSCSAGKLVGKENGTV